MEDAAIDLAVNMQSGTDKRVAVASAHRVGRDGVMFFAELGVVFLPEELVAVMKVVEGAHSSTLMHEHGYTGQGWTE
eukprot:2870850-Prymnesium_polylepis.1